jgi:hypothetical protein
MHFGLTGNILISYDEEVQRRCKTMRRNPERKKRHFGNFERENNQPHLRTLSTMSMQSEHYIPAWGVDILK